MNRKRSEGGGSSGLGLLTYTGSTTPAGVGSGDPRGICNNVVKLWTTLDLSTKTLSFP